MNCYLHPDREAIGTCVGCGKFICAQCTTAAMDKNYCPQCVARGILFQNQPSTNTLAIISMILGIIAIPLMCFGGIFISIAAIITGLIARSQIKKSGNRQSGDGMALAGLILGSVVTGLCIICGGCFLLYYLVNIVIFIIAAQSPHNYSLLTGLGSLLFLI